MRSDWGRRPRCARARGADGPGCGGSLEADHGCGVHWLQPGADVHATDEFGRTALHWAALQGVRADYLAALVDHGADPGSKDDFGDTPLDLAREKKRAKAIAYLESIR